jgi:hypothetical protein
MSADTGKLTAIIGRRVLAFGARFRRPAQPHPELYGLPVGRADSIGVEKERRSMPRQRRLICRLAHPVADLAPNLISIVFFGLGKRKN